jgi:ligand-binding sensor domain-containing protein
VAIDPNDINHYVFGCMDHGLVEMKNNQYKNYGSATPSLLSANAGFGIFVSAVSFDKNSNIWMGLQFGKKAVNVLKKGSSNWIGLNFEQFIVQQAISKILIDKNNQAWIVVPRNQGLLVYKDAIGLSQPNSSNTKFLTTAIGNGYLPSLDIYSICEDKDGHIWVGTAKGVAVFYNPENVFISSNWDSQQILIDQDGQTKILLENDVITAIATDGVNRKWIGTESSGVYCLSADGQEEISHFTKDNSPLYSNLIRDIVTDETTGDVFIATDAGVQSYRTSIIKGFEEYTNVHAYPNPVRPGYSSSVSIIGLVDESEVKITDVSGNLVWSTKSQGGQIEWDMKSFSGTKVASGVYLIYCSTANGDKSATTKLLIVN